MIYIDQSSYLSSFASQTNKETHKSQLTNNTRKTKWYHDKGQRKFVELISCFFFFQNLKCFLHIRSNLEPKSAVEQGAGETLSSTWIRSKELALLTCLATSHVEVIDSWAREEETLDWVALEVQWILESLRQPRLWEHRSSNFQAEKKRHWVHVCHLCFSLNFDSYPFFT